jgi:hypothetical protein
MRRRRRKNEAEEARSKEAEHRMERMRLEGSGRARGEAGSSSEQAGGVVLEMFFWVLFVTHFLSPCQGMCQLGAPPHRLHLHHTPLTAQPIASSFAPLKQDAPSIQ